MDSPPPHYVEPVDLPYLPPDDVAGDLYEFPNVPLVPGGLDTDLGPLIKVPKRQKEYGDIIITNEVVGVQDVDKEMLNSRCLVGHLIGSCVEYNYV